LSRTERAKLLFSICLVRTPQRLGRGRHQKIGEFLDDISDEVGRLGGDVLQERLPLPLLDGVLRESAA
jgi:hypothetical protein